MKTITKFLIAALVIITSSCQILDLSPACKYASSDYGGGLGASFDYDANGKITKMTRNSDPDGSGKILKFVYNFTYDAKGLLSKSVYTFDGKPEGSETYTYTNGKISKVDYKYESGDKGVNNIKYNAAGLMSEFSNESGTPNDAIQYFEYNTVGVLTKRGFKDISGAPVFFEIRINPVGAVKSAASLLPASGLPFDVLFGLPYTKLDRGIGSTLESFFLNDSGKLESLGVDKVTDQKFNKKGYLIEETYLDSEKKTSVFKFNYSGCK